MRHDCFSHVSFSSFKDSLVDVAIAIDLSKKTVKRIWFNFIWAIVYNVVGIPLAAGLLVHWGLQAKLDMK